MFGEITNPIAKITSATILIGVGFAAIFGTIPEASHDIAITLIGATTGFLLGTSVASRAQQS